MIGFTATLTTASLDALIRNLPERLQGACTTAAHAIQQAYETEAPRDTGSMAMSIAVVTADGETDAAARSALADALNPRVHILDMAPAPAAPGALVQVRAEHGEFVEYGTTQMAARPTFTRIVEDTRAPFKAAVAKALEP